MNIDADLSLMGLLLAGCALVLIAAAVLETSGWLQLSPSLRSSTASMTFTGLFCFLSALGGAIEDSAPAWLAVLLFLTAALCLISGLRLEIEARRQLVSKRLSLQE